MCWTRAGLTSFLFIALLLVSTTHGRRTDTVRPGVSSDVTRWLVSVPSVLGGCGGALASRPRVGRVYRGRAAYYSDRLAGRPTASGEPYRTNRLTAAHRTWPFGTKVRVTNVKNQKTVEVRINDRGPFGKRKRIIDLSRRAAETLQMIEAGVVPVTVRVLSVPNAG